MDKDDEELMRELPFLLGTICGALSRPSIRNAVIDLIAKSPEGDFAFDTMQTTRDRFDYLIQGATIIRNRKKKDVQH